MAQTLQLRQAFRKFPLGIPYDFSCSILKDELPKRIRGGEGRGGEERGEEGHDIPFSNLLVSLIYIIVDKITFLFSSRCLILLQLDAWIMHHFHYIVSPNDLRN